MNKKKFRATFNRKEILQSLSTKFADIGSFILWQKDPKTGKRSISQEVKFDSINIKYNFFSIVLETKDLAYFDKDLDTYFVLKNYDFVFKTRFVSASPTDARILLFKIPKDVRLEELRQHPRQILLSNEKATVSAIFENKKDSSKVHTICPVINVSLGGICLMLSSSTVKLINFEKEILLQPITSLPELRVPTNALIRNIRVFAKKSFLKEESFAIGLEFTSCEVNLAQK
jgi:hypothetical protein